MILAVNQVLLIFKTNINTPEKINKIRSLFDNNPLIEDWSVDLLDQDCVLRIEAIDGLTIDEVQLTLHQNGFEIQLLDD